MQKSPIFSLDTCPNVLCEQVVFVTYAELVLGKKYIIIMLAYWGKLNFAKVK